MYAISPFHNEILKKCNNLPNHMKIAFFLGAGASVCAGMPTTKQLMHGTLAKHQNCVLGSILMHYTGDDIEALYGDITALLALKSNKALTDLRVGWTGNPEKNLIQSYEGPYYDITMCKDHDMLNPDNINEDLFKPMFEQLQTLKLAARNHMFDVIRINSKRSEGYWKAFARLRKFSDKESMTIITTNYDMLVEEYCSKRGIKVVDGFINEPNSLRGKWTGQFPADGPHIKLIKLHGSLNWHKDDKKKIVRESSITQHEFTQDILIAPTPSKQGKKKAPYNTLLKQFGEVLSDLDLLVVIGFSFRDEILCNMVKAKADDGMHVICVSKTLDGWPAKNCQQLHVQDGRIEAINGQDKHPNMYGFESEFGSEQMGDIMPILKDVKKRALAYARERA